MAEATEQSSLGGSSSGAGSDELRVFEGQDHHFLKSRRALGEAALPVVAPEVAAQ